MNPMLEVISERQRNLVSSISDQKEHIEKLEKRIKELEIREELNSDLTEHLNDINNRQFRSIYKSIEKLEKRNIWIEDTLKKIGNLYMVLNDCLNKRDKDKIYEDASNAEKHYHINKRIEKLEEARVIVFNSGKENIAETLSSCVAQISTLKDKIEKLEEDNKKWSDVYCKDYMDRFGKPSNNHQKREECTTGWIEKIFSDLSYFNKRIYQLEIKAEHKEPKPESKKEKCEVCTTGVKLVSRVSFLHASKCYNFPYCPNCGTKNE